MQNKAEQYNIEYVKEEVINTSLVVASLVGGLAYFVTLFSRLQSGSFNFSMGFETFALLSLLIVTIRRKSMGNTPKAALMVSLILFLSLSDVFFYGILSTARVYLILVPLYAIIYFPFVRSLILFLVSICVFIIIGYFHHLEILQLPKGYETISHSLKISTWIINAIHILSVGLIILYVTRKVFKAFSGLILDLELQNTRISESERNYREIFNSTTEAIFIHDANSGYVYDVNDAMLRIYGVGSKEDACKLSIADLSAENNSDTQRKAQSLIREAVKEGTQVFEWSSARKNGELFYSEISLKSTEIGGEGRVLAVVRDITERKQTALELEKYRNSLEMLVKERTEELETTNEELQATNEEIYNHKEELQTALTKLQSTQQQLVQSEKMATLGVLAAGVAHEINNPLNFIHGGVTALEKYIKDSAAEHLKELSPLVEIINTGVSRAVGIVEGLSHYSRSDELQKVIDCNIHKIIDNCLLMLDNKIKKRIVVDRKYSIKLTLVSCKEGKMHQAFLNILTNAVQAIEGEGTITITTSQKNRTLIVAVTDSGCGISKQNISKITDPFFTTKDPGKGTGLGLSITQNIIEEHNGKIIFDSEPGVGTTVTVRLPLNG
ncbi:MAG: ATP-binding protein [Bacteroidales bacterium]|jgi:PAS domain S-box-containing protein|nr:ATP-binding protein [Bacteroidales bacterium]MDY0198335.1 ATP-binding protein [Tenuifilaceae bacterium]